MCRGDCGPFVIVGSCWWSYSTHLFPGQGLEAPATASLKFRLSSSESLALGLPSPWEKLVASTIRMLARKAI